MKRKLGIGIVLSLVLVVGLVAFANNAHAVGGGYVMEEQLDGPPPGFTCGSGQIPWQHQIYGYWMCIDPYTYNFYKTNTSVLTGCQEKVHRHGPVYDWVYQWTSTTTTAWCTEIFLDNKVLTVVGSGWCDLTGCDPICGYGWCVDGLNPQEDRVHVWKQSGQNANFIRILWVNGRPVPH
jgi:hypothetical protein